MQYALFGDIHSAKEDLEKVLAHINEKSPTAVHIGTGDLFECTISKKKITDYKYEKLQDVMIIPEGFLEMLDFSSIRGNQEERIVSITRSNDALRSQIAMLPEILKIGNAKVIHGHQWKWEGTPWSLIDTGVEDDPLIFYGHSHRSELRINTIQQDIEFGVPYLLEDGQAYVNVGAVISDREWVLYDSLANTVTFMKAATDT
ncbi:metallophosphoesterase family protein [Sporosarcina sp. CAU 1771]